MKKKLLSLLLGIGAFTLCGCGSSAKTTTKESLVYTGSISYNLGVEAVDWGASVTSLIVTFDDAVDPETVDTDTFTIKASGVKRTILDVYSSDTRGNKTESVGNTITFKMRTGWSSVALAGVENSSAFDTTDTAHYNMIKGGYTMTLNDGKSVKIGDAIYTSLTMNKEDYNERITPSVECLRKEAYEGSVASYNYAAFETDEMKGDGVKNPLIIALHGANNGGDDVDVAVLGFAGTPLYSDEIQSYFTTDGNTGAYVLFPQSPQSTWNLENIPDLMSLIESYVAENGDIDTSRIYLGGCSNGGWMTMNMITSYPDYFAAAFPTCPYETGMDYDTLSRVKDMPVWFTHSMDDPLIDYTRSAGMYYDLVKAGSDKAVYSLVEHVTSKDGSTIYYGHFSQILVVSNRVSKTYDNETIRGISTKEEALTGMNHASDADVLIDGKSVTFMEWLAAQKKEDEE